MTGDRLTEPLVIHFEGPSHPNEHRLVYIEGGNPPTHIERRDGADALGAERWVGVDTNETETISNDCHAWPSEWIDALVPALLAYPERQAKTGRDELDILRAIIELFGGDAYDVDSIEAANEHLGDLAAGQAKRTEELSRDRARLMAAITEGLGGLATMDIDALVSNLGVVLQGVPRIDGVSIIEKLLEAIEVEFAAAHRDSRRYAYLDGMLDAYKRAIEELDLAQGEAQDSDSGSDTASVDLRAAVESVLADLEAEADAKPRHGQGYREAADWLRAALGSEAAEADAPPASRPPSNAPTEPGLWLLDGHEVSILRWCEPGGGAPMGVMLAPGIVTSVDSIAVERWGGSVEETRDAAALVLDCLTAELEDPDRPEESPVAAVRRIRAALEQLRVEVLVFLADIERGDGNLVNLAFSRLRKALEAK